MSPRRLLHIPRHTLRIATYVVATVLGVGVVLFFSLTRTEVGRDALTARIEQMTDAERAVYAERVEQGLAELAKRLRRQD